MLYLAADHAGYEMKEYLRHQLAARQVAFEDFGTFTDQPTDFPGYAKQVARAVVKEGGKGIAICGSAIGMCIVTNRHKGVRAGVAWNPEVARRGREEDDINVLCLPARFLTNEQAWDITSAFLSTTFTHLDRYKRRLKQIDNP